MLFPLVGLDLARCLLVGSDQGPALHCKSKGRSVSTGAGTKPDCVAASIEARTLDFT